MYGRVCQSSWAETSSWYHSTFQCSSGKTCLPLLLGSNDPEESTWTAFLTYKNSKDTIIHIPNLDKNIAVGGKKIHQSLLQINTFRCEKTYRRDATELFMICRFSVNWECGRKHQTLSSKCPLWPSLGWTDLRDPIIWEINWNWCGSDWWSDIEVLAIIIVAFAGLFVPVRLWGWASREILEQPSAIPTYKW